MKIFFKTWFAYLLVIFLFQSGLQAQLFEKLNGPYGGGGIVYEGSNGNLFQILKDYGINQILYSSQDDGNNWTLVASPSLLYRCYLLGLDNSLFCYNSDTVYKSRDNGLTWELLKLPNSPNTSVSGLCSMPNGAILVRDWFQTWLSNDNGKTWSLNDLEYIENVFYNYRTNEAYATSYYNIYVSNDYGLHWKVFYADTFAFANKNFIVTTDGTRFFTGLNNIWKFDSNGKFIKKLFPNNLPMQDYSLAYTWYRLFLSNGSQSWYSDDLGESWTEFYGNKFRYFSASSSGTIFGDKAEGGLYRTVDLGKYWAFSANGINQATISNVSFISNKRVLALTSRELFYSGDEGMNWNMNFQRSNIYSYYTDVSLLRNIGDEIYLGDDVGIYYFKDWLTKPVIVRRVQSYELAEVYVNELYGSVFSLEKNQLFRSNNKGSDWTYIPLNKVAKCFTFSNGSMIVTADGGIYRSSDNGDNWSMVYRDTIGTFGYIAGSGLSTAYIVLFDSGNSYRIVATSDYGITWSVIKIPDQFAKLISPEYGFVCNNKGHLFVTGKGRDNIYVSIDKGSTFNLFSSIETDIINLGMTPDQKILLFTYSDGLYRSLMSTSSYRVLAGNVFWDEDKDCVKDSMELNLANRIVHGISNSGEQFAYTDKHGNFGMLLFPDDYSFIIESNNNIWKSCTKSLSASTYNFNDTLSIGLQLKSQCPFLQVDIQSTILRKCSESTIEISYSNTGSMVARDAYLEVYLDTLFDFVNSTIPYSNRIGDVYRFLLGDIGQSESGKIAISVKLSCNSTLGQVHCAEAHIYPDSACVQTSQAKIRTNANCLGDSIELIIKNDGNANMATTKNWSVIDLSKSNNNIFPFDGGTFYLNAGQAFTKRIAARAKVLFIAEQDDSYPYNKISKTEIISCMQNPVPGSFPLSINNLDEEEPYLAKFCERNRGSFDPNEITGFPEGITDKRYIDNEQQLDYVIRFQNTGTDTAFSVRVENKIPAELDLSTLTLGASSHPYQFLVSPDGKLIFSFSNILLADSSINEKASHGFVQYSIKPKNKLSNGTKILNDALIYFDFNDGVNTNTDLHTIGKPIAVKVNEVNHENEIDFQIVPNPMQELSSIFINDKAKNGHYKLSCLDVYSKQLWEKEVNGNGSAIAKGELIPGVYFMVLKSESGEPIKTRKFIVD